MSPVQCTTSPPKRQKTSEISADGIIPTTPPLPDIQRPLRLDLDSEDSISEDSEDSSSDEEWASGAVAAKPGSSRKCNTRGSKLGQSSHGTSARGRSSRGHNPRDAILPLGVLHVADCRSPRLVGNLLRIQIIWLYKGRVVKLQHRQITKQLRSLQRILINLVMCLMLGDQVKSYQGFLQKQYQVLMVKKSIQGDPTPQGNRLFHDVFQC